MERKIQLVGGTTYCVSLPKNWVQKVGLEAKSKVTLKERDDSSLLVCPSLGTTMPQRKCYTLNVKHYGQNIGQVLFALYYAGFEKVSIVSSENIPHNLRSTVKDALAYMSGTEILYEDAKKIEFRVLLDEQKLDIKQLFFRIALIIGSSVDNLLHGADLTEIERNENEIDRLYHLLSKIVFLSSLSVDVLEKCCVKHITSILPYFLIAKKLENIGDNIIEIAREVTKHNIDLKELSFVLKFVKERTRIAINFLFKEKTVLFEKVKTDEITSMKARIKGLHTPNVRYFLLDLVRYCVDIEQELVNISFFNKIAEEDYL